MNVRSSSLTLLIALPAASLAQVSVFDLGTYNSGAYSIGKAVNASGMVAGYAGPLQAGPYRGIAFSGGVGRDLTGDFASAPYQTQAQALNASGVVAGTYKPSSTLAQPMLDDHGATTIVPNVFNGADAAFYGINASGTATGYMKDTTAYLLAHAVTYANGTVTDIGNLGGGAQGYSAQAYAINAGGAVVGVATTVAQTSATFQTNSQRGFLYQSGVMTQIPTLTSVSGPSYARAINDGGLVVGDSPYSSAFLPHAFSYTKDGVLTDLGVLPGGNNSNGYGLNNLGQAVGQSTGTGFTGQHAVLFQGGGVVDLNSLISATSGWTLNIAYGISDTGWITGIGVIGGQQHGFEINLNPVPEPASLAALAFGAVGLVRRRKAVRS